MVSKGQGQFVSGKGEEGGWAEEPEKNGGRGQEEKTGKEE